MANIAPLYVVGRGFEGLALRNDGVALVVLHEGCDIGCRGDLARSGLSSGMKRPMVRLDGLRYAAAAHYIPGVGEV
jgi:hypothetical protein